MIATSRWTRTAGAAIRDWWVDPDGRRDEGSNSLAMVIMLLPILLGAFGLGFDIAHNSYVRNTIQGSLDMALASGSAVTTAGPNGTLVIDPVKAATVTRQVYSSNRQKNAGMTCSGSTYCWNEPAGPPTVSADGKSISYTVQEKTKNFFLNVVGVPTQTYNISGTAEITARND